MAGDWIKMRTNLWDDPRVSNLCDLTGCNEAAVVGGLYWLWATADDHSADGELHGLTLAAIARKTGVPNLGAALCQIGWIEEIDGGVRIVRFDDHNGTSAKKRAQTGKRVANHRSNAEVTQHALQVEDSCVTGALAREDVDVEKKEPIHTPSRVAEISKVMRRYTIDANPAHPTVIAIAEQDVSLETIEAACKDAREKKPNESISAAYIAKKLAGWKQSAAEVNVSGATVRTMKPPDDWFKSHQGIERKGRELGMVARGSESYDSFRERIREEIKRRERGAAA